MSRSKAGGGLESMVRTATKFLVIPDTHVPEHDVHAMDVAEQILADYKPDKLIYIGDFMDMGPLSHWNKGKRKTMEGKRLQSDYEIGNKLLDRHTKLCKDVVYIEGNHELWAQKYVDENPEVEGFFEIDKGLKFDERRAKGVKIKHLQYGDIYTLGKLHFTHGSYTPMHHAKKHVEEYGRNIVYGHLHTVQSYVKVSPVDVNDKHLGLCVGCLCNKNPGWLQNKPNNWVHAVTVGYVRRDGGFNIEPIIISKGVASWNGKTYTSRYKGKTA